MTNEEVREGTDARTEPTPGDAPAGVLSAEQIADMDPLTEEQIEWILDEHYPLGKEAPPIYRAAIHLYAARDDLTSQVAVLAARLHAAEERERTLTAALRSLEWTERTELDEWGHEADTWEYCAVCGNLRQSGHRDDCSLAAALAPPATPQAAAGDEGETT